MGGDLGPRSTLPAALIFAQKHPYIQITLVGDSAQLAENTLSNSLPQNLSIVHAPDVVTMTDKPAQALRHKQQSSMWKVIEMVANGEAQACISGGNTGALMAMGRFLLKTFPGIDRPAICKEVPNQKGSSYVLDLGANVDCSAEQLLQFALMGSVLASISGHSSSPRVGLLNIGSEDNKGNEQIRMASSLLEANDYLNYTGFIEGDGLFSGDVDVVVCDGFIGNVSLKVSEGLAKFLAGQLREQLSANWWSRFVALLALPLLRRWQAKFDPSRYNGASFLGLQGIVIKSHGSADSAGFESALEAALEQVQANIPEKIDKVIAQCLHSDS